MQWDRVTTRGFPPSFFNGAHVSTTEGAFPVQYDLREPEPKSLKAPRTQLRGERALDAFVDSETKLRNAITQRALSYEALQDMTELLTYEREHGESDERRKMEELLEVYKGAATTQEKTEALLAAQAKQFLDARYRALERLFDLVYHDTDIADLFNERVAMLKECERITDAYYVERGEHVRRIEKLQSDNAAERQQELARMTETLKRTADELVISALEKETNQAVEDNRTQLIDELLKLQSRSVPSSKRRDEIAEGAAELRRLLDLERQRLRLAKGRNSNLRAQLAALHKERDAAEAGTQDASSTDMSRHAVPEAVEGAPSGRSAINQLAQLRRQMNSLTQDLECARERRDALTKYSLLQLQGQYNPVSLTVDTFRTTENALDANTNAAVRSVALESLAAVSATLRPIYESGGAGTEEGEEALLSELSLAQTLDDRKMIQNYVVRKINNLFSSRCPTSPALCLLHSSTFDL